MKCNHGNVAATCALCAAIALAPFTHSSSECHEKGVEMTACPFNPGVPTDEHQREPPLPVVETPVAVSAPTSDMPPGRQLFAMPRYDDYYAAHQVAQMNAQMMMRRNAALFAAADREFPPALLTGPIGGR